jgi:hypothetical protein
MAITQAAVITISGVRQDDPYEGDWGMVVMRAPFGSVAAIKIDDGLFSLNYSRRVTN